jgi:hypothetical protein
VLEIGIGAAFLLQGVEGRAHLILRGGGSLGSGVGSLGKGPALLLQVGRTLLGVGGLLRALLFSSGSIDEGRELRRDWHNGGGTHS